MPRRHSCQNGLARQIARRPGFLTDVLPFLPNVLIRASIVGIRESRMSLRTLFVVVTLVSIGVALCATATRWVRAGQKSAMEEYFRALAAHDPRIENLAIGGYQEELGLFTVTSVSFTIRGKPESLVVLFIRIVEEGYETLNINQIGNFSPVMWEWDGAGWAPRCPTLGVDPEYRPPHLPWSGMTLSDLVSHYDEVVQYFSEWPVYPDHRRFTTETGSEIRYCIEPANVNTKHAFIPAE